MALKTGDTLYVVTHVDVVPKHAAEGEKILREFAAAIRDEAGLIRFEVLQEIARPNHFTISSAWESAQVFEAHVGAVRTRKFREALHPLLGSPFDERLHRLAQE
ncbi:MAG: putative quinol monooxygenase [Candidatus Binataceae bacterium]